MNGHVRTKLKTLQWTLRYCFDIVYRVHYKYKKAKQKKKLIYQTDFADQFNDIFIASDTHIFRTVEVFYANFKSINVVRMLTTHNNCHRLTNCDTNCETWWQCESNPKCIPSFSQLSWLHWKTGNQQQHNSNNNNHNRNFNQQKVNPHFI